MRGSKGFRDKNEPEIVKLANESLEHHRHLDTKQKSGLYIALMPEGVGYDLNVICDDVFCVEVKNPNSKQITKKGILPKYFFTKDEIKTRQEILAAGGKYHIILFPNDLMYILGLPLLPKHPLSTLVCDMVRPVICDNCGATYDAHFLEDIPYNISCVRCSCPFGSNTPILKHYELGF